MAGKQRELYESPGEVRFQELSYVREQARVWDAMGGESVSLRLAPACNVCAAGEDKLVLLPATCEFLCTNCDGRSSSIHLHAGRIESR